MCRLYTIIVVVLSTCKRKRKNQHYICSNHRLLQLLILLWCIEVLCAECSIYVRNIHTFRQLVVQVYYYVRTYVCMHIHYFIMYRYDTHARGAFNKNDIYISPLGRSVGSYLDNELPTCRIHCVYSYSQSRTWL